MARNYLKTLDSVTVLDLERPADLRTLTDAEAFLKLHGGHLVCIDEVQNRPDLFPVLKYEADRRGKNGQFLILGSASPELLRQSSESLAGRISYLELTPFTIEELNEIDGDIRRSWIVAPVENAYPIDADRNVWVGNIIDMVNEISNSFRD